MQNLEMRITYSFPALLEKKINLSGIFFLQSIQKTVMRLKFYHTIFISFSFSFFLTTVSNAQPLRLKKEKPLKKNEISVITNPVFNEIKIAESGNDFAEYFIYGMDEKLIRQGWFLNAIPLQYIPPGSYLLTIRTKTEIFKKQFLKLKPEMNKHDSTKNMNDQLCGFLN